MPRAWGGQAVRSVLLEKDIERQIKDFLTIRGWEVRKTNVLVRRGIPGPRIGEPGQADSICLRPTGNLGVVQHFFAEFKAPLAHTKVKRREAQTRWSEQMRTRGFLVYHCPDGEPHPFEHFVAFYRSSFPGER